MHVSRTIWITELPPTATIGAVLELCAPCGVVRAVDMAPQGGCEARVTFYDARDAERACDALRAVQLGQRIIQVRRLPRDEQGADCDTAFVLKKDGTGHVADAAVRDAAAYFGDVANVRGTRDGGRVRFVQFWDTRTYHAALTHGSHRPLDNGDGYLVFEPLRQRRRSPPRGGAREASPTRGQRKRRSRSRSRSPSRGRPRSRISPPPYPREEEEEEEADFSRRLHTLAARVTQLQRERERQRMGPRQREYGE